MIAYLCWESANGQTRDRTTVIKIRKGFKGAPTETGLTPSLKEDQDQHQDRASREQNKPCHPDYTRAESLTS